MEIDREKIKKEFLATSKFKPRNLKVYCGIKFYIKDFFYNNKGKTINECKRDFYNTFNEVCKELQTNGDNIFIEPCRYDSSIITFYKEAIETPEEIEKRLNKAIERRISTI